MPNLIKIKLSLVIFFFLSLCLQIMTETLDNIYDEIPDLKKTYEGILKKTEKEKVLKYINYIRELHGLKQVIYKYEDDIYTSKASLIMCANNTLTHYPDKKMKCYSAEGELGAKSSNLHIAYYSSMSMMPDSKSSVDSWIIDDNVDSLGHRRWILDPFLKYISFGRVDGVPLVNSDYLVTASALKVVNTEFNDITDMTDDFVAYPFHDYPEELFNAEWYLSFSAIIDKKNTWSNQSVSYKKVVIEMTDEKNRKVTVFGIKHDNTGFGIPNFLQWKTGNLKKGMKYNVTIKNVSIKDEIKTYSYWFLFK